MFHLEFAAVDAQHIPVAAMQGLRQNLNRTSLTRAGRPQQQEHSHRPPFRRETCLMHVDIRQYANKRVGLSDQALLQLGHLFIQRCCRIQAARADRSKVIFDHWRRVSFYVQKYTHGGANFRLGSHRLGELFATWRHLQIIHKSRDRSR